MKLDIGLVILMVVALWVIAVVVDSRRKKQPKESDTESLLRSARQGNHLPGAQDDDEFDHEPLRPVAAQPPQIQPPAPLSSQTLPGESQPTTNPSLRVVQWVAGVLIGLLVIDFALYAAASSGIAGFSWDLYLFNLTRFIMPVESIGMSLFVLWVAIGMVLWVAVFLSFHLRRPDKAPGIRNSIFLLLAIVPPLLSIGLLVLLAYQYGQT